MICNKAILNSLSVLHLKLCNLFKLQRFVYGSVSEYNCALHAPGINHSTVMLKNTEIEILFQFPKKEKTLDNGKKLPLPLITFENVKGTLSVH